MPIFLDFFEDLGSEMMSQINTLVDVSGLVLTILDTHLVDHHFHMLLSFVPSSKKWKGLIIFTQNNRRQKCEY